MSKTSRTSITMPAQAKKDSVIEIRAIAQHDMETGLRRLANLCHVTLFISSLAAITE